MKTKNIMQKLLVLLMLSFLFVANTMLAQEVLPTDVTGYETVTITIPASNYDATQGAPQMAPVKYNKQCALVITSDDMGTGEYLNNWALMNGYPLYGDWRLGNDGKVNWGICPRGEDALNAPYSSTYMGDRSQNVNDYQPLTFTDDAGKEHRFTATSAIWPASYNDNNYNHMQDDEAKIMVRTGWSFAQHDVNNITGSTDAEKIASIASRFQPLSELWANNVTGIGLKVMVEPNGDKNYIDATKESDEMCWSIFQSADATHPAISSSVSTWTTSLPTSFSNKDTGSTARTFPNADATKEQNFLTQTKTAIANGNTDAIFYGCHGMGTYPRQLVTDIATDATYKDKVWVTSADEFWEYYNIYNNAIISTPTFSNNQLTFTVQVPKYKKNQFRELTINIPGITNGTGCTLTSSDGTVTTGSYVQTNDASKGYVVNFGMETKILTYIDELTALYRKDPSNLFIKRDAQYLIDQLLPGATKDAKQAALDKEYDYSYRAVANLQENNSTVSTKTLSSGAYDEATDVKYYIPRYILEGGTLYKTSGNGNTTLSGNTVTKPWYGNYLSVNSKNINVAYTYAKEKDNVVFYTEAEDLSEVNTQSGVVPSHNTDWSKYEGRVEALSSNGSGAKRDNNNYGTITTLEPGTYKITIGVVASGSNDGGYYSIRVGGTAEANEVGKYSGATKDALTEFTTDEFTIKASKTVTIYHSGSSNVALDYVFVQKTADFTPSDPTVTFSSNVAAAQVNSTVTLKATPVWNGKGALTSLKFQYKTTGGADSEFTDIATVNDPVSDTEYIQTYTPTSLGTYVFRAVLTDADATTIKTTEDDATAASAGAVAISVQESVPYEGNYTLHLIDNSGTEVFTQTVTHATVSGGNHDPIDNKYRSPFVSQYLYFDSQAEAQANSGTPSFWNQQDIYVGYTVDATKMGEGKVHAIWANTKYMHVNQNAGNSKNAPTGAFECTNVSYDVNNPKASNSTGPYVRNSGISTTTLPFIDNSYMWDLGTDPYNIKLKNKAYGFYLNSTSSGSSPSLTNSESSAVSYCLLYWASYDWTGVDTSASYYRLMYRPDFSTDITTAKAMCQWDEYFRVNRDANNNWAGRAKMYVSTLPAVTLNVLNANNEVECALQYYFKSGATMPGSAENGYTPFNLYRSYTSKHQWYYNATATDAISYGSEVDASKISSNPNIYVKYTLDDAWGSGTFSGTKQPFHLYPSNGGTVHWYVAKFNTNYYLVAPTDATQPLPKSNINDSNFTTYNANTKNYYWAFKGTPYNLKLINMYHGDGKYLGVSKANTAYQASTYLLEDNSDNNVTWEMMDGLEKGNQYPFLRLQKSFNGETEAADHPLYLRRYWQSNQNPILDRTTDGESQLILTEITTTDITKVSLSASASPYYVDEGITLTATATPSPSGTDRVTRLVIEQETSTNVWEEVGTAYTGTDVAGVAEKDATTKAVTVTYEFTPAAEGTYNFRAYAVVDGTDQYSTDEKTAGGDGSTLAITAMVKQLEPKNDSYTLTLIDKDGNELLTEANVPKSRITEVNSISNRNGDPLSNDYRSPLVTTYKYYKGTEAGKTSAQAASDENLIEWENDEYTTVYVGYEVSDAIDLNYSSDGSDGFNSLSSLMNNRKARNATNNDNTKVRDASKFGKMYLLKFKTSQDYYLENTKDSVSKTKTDAGSYVYPYTNGDGPIYLYNDDTYQDTKDNGSSTRTRYPWFLVSPNGDPYHVYITSWQSSHDDKDADAPTNYYSFLRTYYVNSTIGVVTNNVTDDPNTKDGNNVQLLPTDYMILRGNGTDGQYKLMTAGLVNGSRQTVTSIEQYWRNNPTAQYAANQEKNSGTITDETKLTNRGWHKYSSYVNAANWTGSKYTINGKEYGKNYLNEDHWYMSVSVGDGSFDLVETNIDGVLVLLDNHGWEIMRKPIVEHSDPDYNSVKAELRKYDSPMVKNYKFYSTRNVDHKVPGYHKYDITYQTSDKTKITGLTLINTAETITSLADYPEKMSSGALTDLYVTYEVKDEYANSYTGAATEGETAASSFLLRQGSNYAKADGTSITSTATVSEADRWKIKPNFNIDAEMGYLYTGGTDGEKSKSELETLYNTSKTNDFIPNGFDPYNLQIQNTTTSTYFTTNATTATRSSGAWTGNGSTLSLTDATSTFAASTYDNKTLAVTNATFMAVKDQYGNMRLMPRFDHSQVVDNFATLADPATLSAYDATNSQTTQLTTPVTYHIIDNSGNDALQMTVTDGVGLKVPDALKSPMVSAYEFHSTLEHASNAATRGTGDLSVAQEDVYVSYTVDATKMAATKKYAISSGTSNVFLHFVFRGNEATSTYENFLYRYRTDQQKYDQEDVGSPTPAVNQFDHSNLPFVDKTYLWTLGDDPYNITITSEAARNWKYLARNPTSSPTGQVIQKKNVEDASKYCLLYWNGDPTSEYSVLRYTGVNTETYVQYDGNNNGKWVDASANNVDNAKLVIEELPEINVNVVNAAGAVEYTLAGRYVSNASVPASNKVPFFLQRSYTSGQTYYYTLANAAAKENAITAGTVPVAATMTENMTDGKYNIYVRYDLDANWNTENLFVVSTNESKTYYIVKYPANTSTPYLAVNSEKNVIGLSNSISDEAHWAIYGTPYALRLESRANSGYFVGIPENDWSATPQLYNSFDGIISTWELAAYTNSKDDATYKPMPLLRPQGAISRETPLVYLRPNGTSAALADNDANNVRLTFEGAAKVTLTIVDKSGREVISEQVSAATIENTSGDPLSTGLRSPYAKNYKYYATLAEARANSGETALDQAALLGQTEQTVYVGYDAITSDNVAEGETILEMNGTAAYRIRRNKWNSQGMHAVFAPGQTNSSDNNYGWKMDNQTKDCYNGETVNYNTLPFIDRAWAWEFVSENNDPYNVKIRNKATGQYLGCENNSTKQYQTTFATSDANATVYSLLRYGSNTQYLAIYVTDATTSQTGYLTYTDNDGGTWRLRSTRNDPSNSQNDAFAYIRVEKLDTLLDIHIVGPAGTSHAGEVEATIHGYRNSSVGAYSIPAFVPYFLSRAYTSDQKFYYTKEAAIAATSGTEISTVINDNLTDSYGSDGVKDVFVSYTLDDSNWIPSGTTLSDGAKTAYTTIIKPFYSGEGKINWYGIRASAYNADFLKAGTDIPAAITRTSLDTSDADGVEMKKSEWAFIGTPYSLQIVERYHGMSSHLGVADNAATNDRAYVYANGAEGSVTTFELLTGLGNTQSKLFLRPQGSLNAQAPYLYLGGNDDNMPLSKQASSTQGLDLTWVKETDAKTLTFTLYDPQGNSMSSDISDYTFTGVSEGDNLAELFAVTGMKRRYCDYTYYSDNTLTTEVTTASSDANETVYVKWEYADDAPVFSTGSEPRDYQYYMMNASNGSASYVMKVKGNSTDGYTLAPNDGLTPVKEGHHQFALVGTPYGFNLYSRYAGMNVKTNSTGSDLVFSGDATTEAVFDLPIPVNSAITQSTQMDLRMKNNPSRHIWSDANSIWMNNSTGGYLLLTYLIAPVRVFKEGSTAISNIVDHQEYALPLNPNGTPWATTERITDSDLYRSSDTGNPNYYTNDFRHAFCDYTFYHTYDWATGALSNAIPSTGNFAGLPYYGGKNDQFARSFFATYTVDDEQFSKIYVLDNANAQTLKFFGCGTKTTTNEKDYFPIVCDKTTLEAARADDTNAYRWYMTGDPYNLQLTCLGTGDDYQNIPLGVQKVHTTLSDVATVENGMLAQLTNDATYAMKSHWEVVQNTNGNHIFYLVDDVTTYDDTDRYTYSLGQRVYTSPDLYASSNQIYALHLTPAVAQYNVVWTIMEGSSGNYTNVATYTKENVSKGTTFTLDDMPEVLKRHFCEYDNMYSEQTCTTLFANNEATVGNGDLSIFVPYTLTAGAPTFYASVSDYTNTASESSDTYLIRLYEKKYVRELENSNDATVLASNTITTAAAPSEGGQWALIGSPYKVQFYNVLNENYLYVNMGTIQPGASIPVGAGFSEQSGNNPYWTLLDNSKGDKAVICLYEGNNHNLIYMGYDNNNDVVMNLCSSKEQATSAEFVSEKGIDGIKMRLTYNNNTLRKNSSGDGMASQSEAFTIGNYFNQGTKLIDVMPTEMKRAFCNYTFKYNGEDVTENNVNDIITKVLCDDSKNNDKIDADGYITVDVTYTVNSPFDWSTADKDYTGKHWYYLVNNHRPNGELGKMVYRDSGPKLRVSTSLKENQLYLNNFEWCVIGDPYGFKMLNRYDPDRKFSEYISVMNYNDSHNDGLQLEQSDGDTQDVF